MNSFDPSKQLGGDGGDVSDYGTEDGADGVGAIVWPAVMFVFWLGVAIYWCAK